MKILGKPLRSLALAAANGLMPGLIRTLGASARVRLEGLEFIRTRVFPKSVIFAFWHEQLVNVTAFLAIRASGLGVTILIGSHSDGEIIARVVEGLGLNTVRGSKTRGGAAAIGGLLQVLKEGRCVVFTPDGPRGPRRQAKEGVIVIAQRSGAPIIPVAVLARPSLHAGSWDRMEVPLPFARVHAIEGEPIIIPPGADAEEREAYRARLQQELNMLAERAARE